MIKEKGKEICQRVLDTNFNNFGVVKKRIIYYNLGK